ncbi:MAG: hypothetical protein AB1515_03170 [Nitrospirota bacterium]
MATLHIIRRANDLLAIEAASQSGRNSAVLLIQDGVRASVPGPVGGVYASADDLAARGVQTDYPSVTVAQMSELILRHERVLVW